MEGAAAAAAAARQSPRSPSSDGDYSSEDDESNSVLPGGRNRRPMYPMPQSHWFPRSISFGAYVPLRGPRQRISANVRPSVTRQHIGVNAPRLHIQVTRPVHSSPLAQHVSNQHGCSRKMFSLSERFGFDRSSRMAAINACIHFSLRIVRSPYYRIRSFVDA